MSRAIRHRMASLQRGFSTITAIFLLVILAALGAFMVTFTGLQQNTIQADVLGVRAYYAARAGVDWALYRTLDPDNSISAVPADPTVFAACPATTTLSGLGGSLAPFAVTVTCTETTATEANRNIHVYRITATACNQASCPVGGAPPAGYAERQITVTAARCKDPTATGNRFACGA